MYLEKFKSGKNTYIRLVECYRDPNTKTNRKKVIKNYGNVESCVDDPNKARNNFGSTFLKSNPNLTPQKLKILS